jgi:hypothetical protein
MGLAGGGVILGALVTIEGTETATTFRHVGLIALGTCALSGVAMIRAGWDRLPLAVAFALSGLIAWDALFGDREADDPMSSPLIGYLLFDLLAAVCLAAASGMAALGRKR